MHFRVYHNRLGRPAEPVRLTDEFEARRFGTREGWLCVAARTAEAARRAALRYACGHPVTFENRGPGARVPVLLAEA